MIDLYPSGKVEKDGLVLYDPSPTYEAELHRDLLTPNILIFGRRGTAKSWSLRWHLHRLAMQFPGFTALVCRNSKPELQRTHLAFLPAEMDALGGDYAKVEGLATYPNGSTVTYAGFTTEADALKVLGMTLDMLVIEEITTMAWETVISLASTLRSTLESERTPQLIALTNPIGPYSRPVKRHWVDKDLSQTEEPGYDPAEWKAVATVAADNPHLNFVAYDKRLAGLSPAKRAAWLDGQWTDAEGAFFSEFSAERHVITQLPERGGRSIFRHPDIPVYRVIDWGFSADEAVCLWIAMLANGRAIVIKEMSWHRTAAREVAQEVIGHSKDMQIAVTYADGTMWNGQRYGAQSVADLFEIEGVSLTPIANDRHMYGIHEWLNTTVEGTPRLQFWAEGCPKLIATIQQQVPNPKDPERMKDSSTDHHTCALSFFCSGWASGHEPLVVKKEPFWLAKMHDLEASGRHKLGAESVKR
jgi:hypothetical protein